MHPKIKTTEAHEIGHVHSINRGTMVPFFIRYHKLTPFRGISAPPSGARRAEGRHSVFNKSHALQSERDIETKLIRRRSTAEKDLLTSPLACFCSTDVA